MKFKSNARFGLPLELGTIFEFQGNNLGIIIHKINGCGDDWYLSVYSLGIKDARLCMGSFEDAVKFAKNHVEVRIADLKHAAEYFYNDDSEIEITRY